MGEQDARIRDGADGGATRARIAAVDAAFTELLATEVGGAGGPPRRPRPAAALIVLDARDGPPRALMGLRNPKLAFMGGRFVFPGGRVDAADGRMPVLAELSETIVERLSACGSRPAPRAFALAAIRETFEETGCLIGTRGSGPIPAPRGAWRDFVACGVSPRLDGLRLIARAITPPGRVRRFDTAFFCVDAGEIGGRTGKVPGPDDELVELRWIPLADAERYPLPAITRVILRDLDERLAQGLDAPAPVPFYRQLRGRWRRERI